jgi:hypothetical protein
MSEPFHVAVLNKATGETVTERFPTAYRAKKRHEEINAEKGELVAEYVGDSRDRVFVKTSARVREVFAETMREAVTAHATRFLQKRIGEGKPVSHSSGPWRAMRWWEESGMTLADANDDEDRAAWESAPIKRIEAADGSSVVTCHDLAIISPENARLIVAAPKLLEALLNITEFLEANYDHNTAAMEAADIARATIKEARL